MTVQGPHDVDARERIRATRRIQNRPLSKTEYIREAVVDQPRAMEGPAFRGARFVNSTAIADLAVFAPFPNGFLKLCYPQHLAAHCAAAT
jgi:hypothetical protein